MGAYVGPMMDARLTIATDDVWPPAGGIATFAGEVLGGLERLGHRVSRLSTGPLARLAPLTPARPLSISAGLRRHRHEIFYSPGFYPPLWWPGPRVVTVHDLQYLRRGPGHSAVRRHYFQRVLLPLIGACDLVLTVSTESRDELRSALGPSPPVEIVGEGVADEFFLAGKRATARERDRRQPLRLVYVGNWLPHKRADLVVAAAGVASRSTPLILSLPRSAPAPVERLIADLEADPSARIEIERRPRLDVAGLAAAVAGADLLLLLSRHEGFGLPPIEAQAARTPVLVADYGGARRRYGDHGAHYVDVDAGARDVAARIVELARHRDLRASTVEAGVANAETHRWSDVAQRVESAIAGLAP